MIGKLFYLCPACQEEDTLHQENDGLHCQNCLVIIPFINKTIHFNQKSYNISQFYNLIRDNISLKKDIASDVLRISGPAILRQGIKKISFRGQNRTHTTIEVPVEVNQGQLVIKKDKLLFQGKNKEQVFRKTDINSFTTNSSYFEFKVKGRPFFQIYFEKESLLKYEDLFCKWFSENETDPKIIEHQPKIIHKIPSPPSLLIKNKTAVNRERREKFKFIELLLHLIIGLPVVNFLKIYAKLKIKNLSLIPRKGPFVLLVNHESYLDPIIFSTITKRRIGFFTKSTSFSSPILQIIFRAYRSLPNRRYETDPQVVRLALKMLKKGNCIGIFPEGERTWDGTPLAFKYSTIRFLMAIQIPIVVATIRGAFDVLPRWSHKINRGQMEIEVQRFFSLLPGAWQVEALKEELESYLYYKR
jgi:1-acyl-sn-glycerol-3-phosphate acyltransferase